MARITGLVDTAFMRMVRRTLVFPLSGKPPARSVSLTLRAYLQAQRRWRWRVRDLARADSVQLPMKRRLRLHNCPPIGVTFDQHPPVCGDRTLCPWCWVRRCQLPWYRRLRALPVATVPTLLVRTRFWTLPFTVRARALPYQVVPRWEWGSRIDGVTGMLRLLAVWPGARGWRCAERALWYFPEGVPELDREDTAAYAGTTSAGGAAQAVGRALRYPLGLLRGGTRRTMLWLRFRRGHRWLRSWGALYGDPARRRSGPAPSSLDRAPESEGAE